MSSTPAGRPFHEEVYAFARRPTRSAIARRSSTFPATRPTPSRSRSARRVLPEGRPAVRHRPDYALELRERVKEVADELAAIEQSYGELAEKIREARKSFKAEAWKEWKEPWYARVEAIAKKNEERYSLWAVWMERQAKMRIGGMCELLRRIMVGADEQFLEGAKNDERQQEMLKGFHDYFEEAIEVIGINAPLDIRTVGPLMAAYDKALAPLRAWIAKPEGDFVPVLRVARRDGLGSLLELVQHLQNRKRGYLYLNEVSSRFTRLLEHFDPKPAPEALKKGLEEHDAALAEFKKFAGLK